MGKVLHILSQRPSLTGSGITLDALVRHAGRRGWDQCVAVGVPADDPAPAVGGIDPGRILPLLFGGGGLEYPVPGMSDVMPYLSTTFSSMTPGMVESYKNAWRRHLGGIISEFQPDLIHSHHVWIVSSLLKEIAPEIPLIAHCHATGFRQMRLCPHLAGEVRKGCAGIDRFMVLHAADGEELGSTLGVPASRIHVVGAGYREELFHAREPGDRDGNILYIGKYSEAKGLPYLLDAMERIGEVVPGVRLHVAGSGAGEEAGRLRARMERMGKTVVLHGQLSQAELASLMRRCAVCVLPSFYEGVPLVLVEAFAGGCRIVATDLPGIRSELAPALGEAMEMVSLPRLRTIDTPEPGEIPAFTERLARAISSALDRPAIGDPAETFPEALAPFRWSSIFRRVEKVWSELLDRTLEF